MQGAKDAEHSPTDPRQRPTLDGAGSRTEVFGSGWYTDLASSGDAAGKAVLDCPTAESGRGDSRPAYPLSGADREKATRCESLTKSEGPGLVTRAPLFTPDFVYIGL